jgi:hypothetical protein
VYPMDDAIHVPPFIHGLLPQGLPINHYSVTNTKLTLIIYRHIHRIHLLYMLYSKNVPTIWRDKLLNIL